MNSKETIGFHMSKYGEIVFDALLIGMSSAFLWHFSNIWRYEKLFITEPNIWIRSIETAGLIMVFILGIGKCVRDLRRMVSSKGKRGDRDM